MSEVATNEAIARLAPGVFKYFQGRGLIDFRVFPHKPAVLFVYVHFFCERSHPSDVDVLTAVAAGAGLEVERSCLYGETAWVEVSTRRAAPAEALATGTVVPFAPRLRARAGMGR